ncbi:hypothetical protein [Bradyrhizobium cenepequi]|uniref:hypothetical protein n=1 Tax=Bradyrhizobium cenepequi TaxID=2821403 RepID=UPI001CE2B290|nr:hypothetical protein [Bradyrhizobium cenepequi]MCA6108017.1 hypothetical protein [Bradyrhizobium cenepequi]
MRMIANLARTPVRIGLPLMKPEGCEVVPPVEFASDDSKELKESLQGMLCRQAAGGPRQQSGKGDRLINEAAFA